MNSPDNKGSYRNIYPYGAKIDLDSSEDVSNFKRFAGAQRKTRKQFVHAQVGKMERQYSNGENALLFFQKEIKRDAVYLLDEPENSLSAFLQLQLKALIEDAVFYNNCQFIIATHSPFILSLKNAKVYNLDTTPVSVERWYKLENMRHYYDLFKSNENLFESEF